MNPFESPRLLLVIALVLEAGLVLAWLANRQKVKIWLLLIGPAVGGLGVLLDFLVTTNPEELTSTTHRLIAATENEDAEGVINLLSDSFLHKDQIRKAAASQTVRGYLRRNLIRSNEIKDLAVTRAQEHSGQVRFRLATYFDTNNSPIPFLLSEWNFDYTRDPDGHYRIRDITMNQFSMDLLNQQMQPGFDVFSGRPPGFRF